MAFFGTAIWAGHPPSMTAYERRLGAQHSGRVLKAEGTGFGVCALTDHFLEGLPDDCLFHHTDSGVICAADARIDNAAALKDVAFAHSNGNPAALIAACYLRYGLAFPAKLIGDFAAVLWDDRARRLLLLADRFSTRNISYRAARGQIDFSSDLRLLDAVSASPRFDAERLITFFMEKARPGALTPQAGIERVRPGHLAIFEAGKHHQWRYWQPEDAPDIRFRRADDYLEAAEAVLREAVRCRLPRRLKVGSHLSGGLDSPIIAGTAATLLAPEHRRLPVFTLAHTDPSIAQTWNGAYWDEHRSASDFAAGFANIDLHVVSTDAANLIEPIESCIFATAMPMSWSLVANTSRLGLARAARQAGVDVMLTGSAGNETISQGSSAYLGTLLRRGQWLTLLRAGIGMQRYGVARKSILGNAIAPLLPEWVIDRLRRGAAQGGLSLDQIVPFRAAIKTSQQFTRQVQNHRDALRWRRTSPRATAQFLAQFSFGDGEAWHREGFHLDYRSPYTDARVVTFCAGLPAEQFIGGGEPRHLARQILRRLGAPPHLTNETRTGTLWANWHGQMLRAVPQMLAEIDALQTSPSAARVIDLDDLRQRLAALPDLDPTQQKNFFLYSHGVGIGIGLGRYIRYLEHSNAGPPLDNGPEENTPPSARRRQHGEDQHDPSRQHRIAESGPA